MGCFLACFGSVDGKRRKRGKKTLPRDRSNRSYASLQPTSPLEQTEKETAVSLVLESSDKPEDPGNKLEDLSFDSRKKVTFDLNVKTYNAGFSTKERENSNLSSETDEEKERENEDKKEVKGNQSLAQSEDSSTTSSSGSYPSNHRYGNCVSSDDEAEYEDSNFDDEDDDDSHDEDIEEEEEEEEEYFDSCFSLPMEKERGISAGLMAKKEFTDARPVCSSSPDRNPSLLINGNARDRSQYVHSVLNPVENLSQWKAAKAKAATPLKHQKKENVDLDQQLHIPFSAEPIFKAPISQKSVECPSFNITKTTPKEEFPVNVSLSNWLVSSKTTPPSTKTSIALTESSENSKSQRSYSSRNHEDRPILGALTVEELRQSSSSSPRKSPSRSPDEIPIVGTVGSYWSHSNEAVDSSTSQRSGSDSKGIPNTTSKYTEVLRML